MYYVDKSLLIKELLDSNDRGVFLFTRPRRFGKTTNLSMLDAFFNIRYAGNPWFDDLEISRYPEYTGYKNRFPVIHLNLNDTKANTYESYINKLRIAVKDAYEPHRYLLEDDDLDTAVRDNFDSFARRNISEDFLSTSIKDLSDAISRINRRPIILIDEYDRAVTDNFGKKSQKDILDFLGDFLCSALKTNANRETAEVQIPFEEDDGPVQRRLYRTDTHQDRGGGCKRSPRNRTGESERNVADMLGMRRVVPHTNGTSTFGPKKLRKAVSKDVRVPMERPNAIIADLESGSVTGRLPDGHHGISSGTVEARAPSDRDVREPMGPYRMSRMSPHPPVIVPPTDPDIPFSSVMSMDPTRLLSEAVES